MHLSTGLAPPNRAHQTPVVVTMSRPASRGPRWSWTWDARWAGPGLGPRPGRPARPEPGTLRTAPCRIPSPSYHSTVGSGGVGECGGREWGSVEGGVGSVEGGSGGVWREGVGECGGREGDMKVEGEERGGP